MSILVTVLYLAFAFFLWTRLYTVLYRDHMEQFGDVLGWRDSDRVFAIVWGGFVCLLWPIFLPLGILIWAARAVGRTGILSRLEK